MKTWLTGMLSALLFGLSLQARAVEYALPDIDGRMHALDQYRGKWVIVNYWASWCGTCRKELPDLISLHERHRGKDIVVVGINFEDIGQRELAQFVSEQNIPYPVLRSKPVRNTPLGPVPALPTTYIVDPDGKTVAGEVGLLTQKNIEDYIAAQRRM